MLRERGAALEAQRHVGDAPAVVLGTDTIRDRHARVVEEHFAEVALAVDRAHRPHVDTRLVHIEDQPRDALVLRRVGIGAYEQFAVVGDVGASTPDLLAVDDVLIAVALGARAQRSEIRPGAGFREALTPHTVAAQDAGKVERALFVGAFGDQCRARVHHADEVDTDVRRVGARVFLEVHELLADGEPAAPERRRPMEARVAGVMELALPCGVVRAACEPVARRWRRSVARDFDLQPRAQLLAEPLVFVAVGQVHDSTGRSVTARLVSDSSAPLSVSAWLSAVPNACSSTHARLRK